MSEPVSRTNDLLHTYQDWFRAPQLFLPNAHFTATVSAAARGFVEAQVAYLQAMMGLNAKLLEALLETSGQASDPHPVPVKPVAARVAA